MENKPNKPGSLLLWIAIVLLLFAPTAFVYLVDVNSVHAETEKEIKPVPASLNYTQKDLKGPTSFSFDGIVTLSIEGVSVAIPVSAVGQVNWDGNGNATSATRIFNFGGAVILRQSAVGEYQVNPDGTGSARFEVTTLEVIGALPPGVQLPEVTVETFSFVMNQDNELQFIGTGLLDKNSGQPLAAVAVRGELHNQR